MKEITREELKAAQLDVLDVIVKFCEEHDIKYFLAFGTLIGAVRHKGYIPWDDDIDIAMLRSDYDKFAELFNKQNKKYVFREGVLVNYVFNTESKLAAAHVDIFVVDNAPDDNKVLKRMILRQKILIGCLISKGQKLFQRPHGNAWRRFCVYCVRIIANLMCVN